MQSASNDDLSAWLKNAGKYELLRPDEELTLARTIAAGCVENATTREKYAARKARERLINSNLRLVYSVAKKYFRHATAGHSAEDMLQDGVIGLSRAADMFDPSRGYKFSTYAYWWIRQGIGRELNNAQRTIRLPTHTVEKLNKLRRVSEELYKASGKVPSFDDAAAAAGVEPSTARHLLTMSSSLASTDETIGDGGTRQIDLIASPDDEEADDRPERFTQALEHCHPLEREVLQLRMNGAGSPQIAKVLGVSRQTAANYMSKAIQRVQQVVG